jgi:hypothetical protein
MEDRWPLRAANLYVPGGTPDTGSLEESPDIGFPLQNVYHLKLMHLSDDPRPLQQGEYHITKY